MTLKEQTVLNRIEEMTYKGELSGECLVQIIKLCGQYLNLETISVCAKREGKSYNGILKTRKAVNLFGTKFVTQ